VRNYDIDTLMYCSTTNNFYFKCIWNAQWRANL